MRLCICGASVIPPSRRPVLVWIRNSAFYDVDGLAVQLGWLRSYTWIHMDRSSQTESLPRARTCRRLPHLRYKTYSICGKLIEVFMGLWICFSVELQWFLQAAGRFLRGSEIQLFMMLMALQCSLALSDSYTWTHKDRSPQTEVCQQWPG